MARPNRLASATRRTRDTWDNSWRSLGHILDAEENAAGTNGNGHSTAQASVPSTNTSNPIPRGGRLPYFPGLDGLRALAVIAVILYHAEAAVFPGGFIGVEVFFVISGFLITSLLVTEHDLRGSIRLSSFWLRRARRLLPAVYTMIVVVLAYAVLLLPDEVASLRGDALASFGYVTNWYLILDHKSYFEAVSRPSLLRHLWSLAVEEQFYLFWPPILVLLLRFLPRRGLAPAALLLSAASACLMASLYVPDEDPSLIYYGTDTRATGLLIGAALAFMSNPGKAPSATGPRRATLVELSGVAALAFLTFFTLRVNEFDPFVYQGGFAAVAIASAALIHLVTRPDSRVIRRLLSFPPLGWIGTRSYSIYLWHWPVFMVTRPYLDVSFDGLPLLGIRLLVTLALAEVSYRFVETPVRRGALGKDWSAIRNADGRRAFWLGARWVAVGGVLIGGLVVLGGKVVEATQPRPPDYLVAEIDQAANRGEGRAEVGKGGELTPTTIAEPTASQVSFATGAATPTAPAPVATSHPSIALTERKEQAILSDGSIATESPTETSASATSVATPAPDPTPTCTPASEESHGSASTTMLDSGTPGPNVTSTPPAAGVGQAQQSQEEPIHAYAIGDSVMLGATGELKRALGDVVVDAAISRQVSSAIEIVKSRRAAGSLSDVVIVHVGNNGPFSARQFDQLMDLLADTRLVVFVNLKVPRAWEAPNNQVIAEGVRRYPNTVLVDWQATSAKSPGLFWDDGIHIRPEGAKVFAELVAEKIHGAIH